MDTTKKTRFGKKESADIREDLGEQHTLLADESSPSSPEDRNREPTRLVRAVSYFELMDKIGEGGVGIVHRAKEQALKRQVALKQLNPAISHLDHIKDSFRAEALITGKLAHPNVVPIYGMIDANNELAIAMKLIGGRTLHELIHSPADPVQEDGVEQDLVKKIEILIAVCNAVCFAHSKHIIHRDIKPRNIMVGEFGEILLLDWGLAVSIAEAKEADEAAHLPHKSDVTGGEGSPLYMPAEMMSPDGSRLGVQTDVYLLGGCLYEIISGEPPHTARRRVDLAKAEPDAVPPLPQEVETELREICERALETEMERRYPTVRAFQKALLDYLRHDRSRAACRAAIELFDGAKQKIDSGQDNLKRTEVYDLFAGAVHGFRNAVDMWPNNQDARRGEREARLAYAETARELNDYGLALMQLEPLDGDETDSLKAEIRAQESVALDSLRMRAMAKRVAAAAVLLIAITAIMVVFVFMGAASGGKKVAEKIQHQLAVEGRNQLARTVRNAANDISAKKQLIGTALVSFAGCIEKAMSQDAPLALHPLMSRDLTRGAPVPFKTEARQRYNGIKDGEVLPIPVTFEAMAYTVPGDVLDDTAKRQIDRLETVTPRVAKMLERSQPYVFRFFAGFEKTKLYAAYPGAGFLPTDYDPTVHNWYRGAVGENGLDYVLPYLDATTGRVVSSASLPLRDADGALLGVAGVDVYMSDLLDGMALPTHWNDQAKTEIVQIGDERAPNEILVLFSVLDDAEYLRVQKQSGDVIPSVVPADAAVFAKMKRDARAGRSGVVEAVVGGIPVHLGYAPLHEETAQVMITVPTAAMTAMSNDIESDIVSHTEAQLWDMAKVVTIVFVLILAGIVWATRRVR